MASKNMLLNIDSYDKEIVIDIVSKMEKIYSLSRSYVQLGSFEYECMNFSNKEIEVINNTPIIFYKCTPKRVVLVKWILDEIEKIFKENRIHVISLEDLYTMLRNRFGTSFNRHNFRQLFSKDYELVYEKFVSIKERYLDEYNNLCKRNNDGRFSSDIKTSDNIKKFICSLFGEDIYNINESRQFDDELKLSFEEIDVKNRILKAREDLGDELCIKLLKDTNVTLYFFDLLCPYAKLAEEYEYNKQQIKKAIDNVNATLLSARLEPLLLANRRIDDESKKSILQLFKKNRIVYVNQLPDLLSLLDIKIATPLISFINWLNDDLVSAIQNEFKELFKTERDEGIIKIRATGATLEATSREYGITRERVRQLERKLLDRFKSFVSRKRPHFILQAFTQNYTVLTTDEIENKIGLSDVFIYCLKECNSEEVLWIDELKGFIIGDRAWYKQLREYIDALPDMFEASDMDKFIANILDSVDMEVNRNFVFELILTEYNLIGRFYSKKKIGKKDIYMSVLERYYPHGIKLFDDFEMMRFRNFAKDMFGDIELPENDKAICARIADITVLCDRGKYILPSRISIDHEIFDKIYRFIVDNERNVIMFVELFERFKADLLDKTSIDNRFYLQGVLKYKYSIEFYFTKDTIIKDLNSEQNIKFLIEEYIRAQNRIVNKDEIKEEFLGLTEIVLSMAIANNTNILLWDFGKYLHSEQLVVNDADRKRFKKLLDDYTAQGSVSVRKIYRDIYILENEFLIVNNIEGHIALFSLFNFLFPDDYEFSRPYIAPKGSMATTFETVVREYLLSLNEVYISDFKEYIDSIRAGNFSISMILDDISDEFIRIDSDLLFRKDRLNLSEDIIKNIEETTLTLIGSIGYLSVKNLQDFLFYPDIGVKWTPFLLVSIVKYFCKRLKIINTATDYRYLNEVIIDASLNINDYDELLRYAIKEEAKYTSFKTVEKIKRFLLDQGLIANNIPQSLFDKGYITDDEYGGINLV